MVQPKSNQNQRPNSARTPQTATRSPVIYDASWVGYGKLPSLRFTPISVKYGEREGGRARSAASPTGFAEEIGDVAFW